MAKRSLSFRLHLTESDAVKAVSEAIETGRTKYGIKERGDTYFKVKQRHSCVYAPVSMEIGFRKESPTTTVVLIDGGTWWLDLSSRGVRRTESILAKFQDDVESCASRYVTQR